MELSGGVNAVINIQGRERNSEQVHAISVSDIDRSVNKTSLLLTLLMHKGELICDETREAMSDQLSEIRDQLIRLKGELL